MPYSERLLHSMLIVACLRPLRRTSTTRLPPQLLDLNEILSVGTQIAAGFLDVLKCNILPTLTGQVCCGMLALSSHSLQPALCTNLLHGS